MAQIIELDQQEEEDSFVEVDAGLISAFYAFDTGITDYSVLNIRRNINGLISETSSVIHEQTGRGFFIRRINPIFDIEAINTNLRLLEEAQVGVLEMLPTYWKPVRFYSVRGSDNRIFTDEDRNAWVLMDAIEGTVFNQLNDVPKDERYQIASATGRGIAAFEHMVSVISQDCWRKPLPNHRNLKYHFDYLMNVLNGNEVVLSMHRNGERVQRDEFVIATYFDRIQALCRIIDSCQDIANFQVQLGETIIHDDLKINNCIFQKVDGMWQLVSLVDLDTLGVGPALIDIADAIRSSGNPAGEQPENLDMIDPDIGIVDTIIDEYLKQTDKYGLRKYPPDIRDRIYNTYQQVLYMLGIRFFADALVGNRYFKLKPGEPQDLNLYRAEVQFRLLTKLREKRK
jgi:serine/threonine protein kinase